MAEASESKIFSFTREEVSNIYQAALELDLDEDLDEAEWWGNYAPVFNVAKCWLSGDKDKAVQLVHHTSLHLLDWVCEKFCDEGWDWDDVMLSANYEGFAEKMPDSKFGELLKAMEEALKCANLNLYTFESTLDRFREFPLLSSQGKFIEGVSCFAEGTIYCGGAHFAGIALDSDLEKESIFICRNFSEVRTGFDCHSAVFRVEHPDFETPIGLVVKSYGPWTSSFFGEGFVHSVDEAIDKPDTEIPASLVLDGIQKAIEFNKPFEITQRLGVTGVSLPGDDEIEVDFQPDEIAVYMPGLYRTFALNTEYAEITLDEDGDIDWNESATLFINEKAMDVLGLSVR